MRLRLALSCILVLAPLTRAAAGPNYTYDQYTIRVSDIPPDAPRFQSYPVSPYNGRNVKPLVTDPDSKMFRARIKEWSREKPNFAGHYILALWGCGTDCTQLAIIDAKTGRVSHPAGISSNSAVNVEDDLLEGGDFWHSSGSIKYRRDSRLLVVFGMPDEDIARRGISYYVWNGKNLSLVRHVHKGWQGDGLSAAQVR